MKDDQADDQGDDQADDTTGAGTRFLYAMIGQMIVYGISHAVLDYATSDDPQKVADFEKLIGPAAVERLKPLRESGFLKDLLGDDVVDDDHDGEYK